MTAPHGAQDRLDHMARQLHGEALRQLSPRTLARLRPRPAPTPALVRWRAQRPAFAFAGVCALALAVLVGTQLLPGPPDMVAPGTATMAQQAAPVPASDPLATLEEDPDLFVWLASIEARPLAME